MTQLEELYARTSMPVNMDLLDTLIEKYLSIPLKDVNYSESRVQAIEMTRDHSLLTSLMYNQINAYQKVNVQTEKVKREENYFISKLNQDFSNAGKPFDPSLHGGIRNPLGVQNGWLTFKSWNLLGTKRIHNGDQLHRFYIGVSSNDKFDFSNELYEAFKRTHIPFYFKVESSLDDRPDKVVIYTSTSLLEQTMQVINSVANRRPDLMHNCIEPSVVVGKVTDKIGYASETPGIKKSYTQKICLAFVDAVEFATNEYQDKHKSKNMEESIKIILYQKIQELKDYNMESYGKKKVLSDILLKHSPDFKLRVLDLFRKNLKNEGIDLDNMCFSTEVKELMLSQSNIAQTESDIFDPNVLRQIITLPNGFRITVRDYLINNHLLEIPLNAKVVIGRTGDVISGIQLIKGVIKRAHLFNSVEEIFSYYGIVVDRNITVEENPGKKM